MIIKKIRQFRPFIVIFMLLLLRAAHAQTALGEFVTINTHLTCVFARPSWLLILRDLESGQVLPYMYDFYQGNNQWLALTYGHHYQVTASKITFSPSVVINNFCGLEQHVLFHMSMYISLTGALTPNRNSSKCYVTYLENYPLRLTGA